MVEEAWTYISEYVNKCVFLELQVKFVENAEGLATKLTSLQKKSVKLTQQMKELSEKVQKQMKELLRKEVK